LVSIFIYTQFDKIVNMLFWMSIFRAFAQAREKRIHGYASTVDFRGKLAAKAVVFLFPVDS